MKGLEKYGRGLEFIMWKTQKGETIGARKPAPSVEEGDGSSPGAEESWGRSVVPRKGGTRLESGQEWWAGKEERV